MAKETAAGGSSLNTKRALVIVLPLFFVGSVGLGMWAESSSYPLEESDAFVWISLAVGVVLLVGSVILARSGRRRAGKLALIFALVLPFPLLSLLAFVNYVADGSPEAVETTVLTVEVRRQPGQSRTYFARIAPLPGRVAPEALPICVEAFEAFDGHPDAPATIYYGNGALGAPWLDQVEGCLRLEPQE